MANEQSSLHIGVGVRMYYLILSGQQGRESVWERERENHKTTRATFPVKRFPFLSGNLNVFIVIKKKKKKNLFKTTENKEK